MLRHRVGFLVNESRYRLYRYTGAHKTTSGNRNKVPASKIIAVVKANAYGHGLYPIANALSEEADAFAVSRIGEAISLRNQGIVKPIVLLEAFIMTVRLGLFPAMISILPFTILNKLKLLKERISTRASMYG